jgi:RNA polymerase sigma-70 factor (ECF subfamily)
MHAMIGVLSDPAIPAARALSRHDGLEYARRMGDLPTDAALMLRYRDGDVDAFDLLYRRHNDGLYRYLLRLCLNRHTAEDLYQEVWSRVIKARRRYRPTAKFATYLFRIAHNCFVDHLRRNSRIAAGSGVDPDQLMDSSIATLEEQTERALLRRRLAVALEQLPDEQREVFLLVEEAGLSLDDIAAITGVHRETAKSRLRYANKKLKAALTDRASPGLTASSADGGSSA